MKLKKIYYRIVIIFMAALFLPLFLLAGLAEGIKEWLRTTIETWEYD